MRARVCVCVCVCVWPVPSQVCREVKLYKIQRAKRTKCLPSVFTGSKLQHATWKHCTVVESYSLANSEIPQSSFDRSMTRTKRITFSNTVLKLANSDSVVLLFKN